MSEVEVRGKADVNAETSMPLEFRSSAFCVDDRQST